MHKKILFILAFIALTGCLPTSSPSFSAPTITTGESLLSETFSTQGNWMQFNTPAYSASVRDGVYRLSLTEPNQYIWGTDNSQYNDTVIDVDLTWQSDNANAFAGVICRLQPNSGLGYYIVVSKSGDFSIRYIGRNRDDAIVRWQANSRIPTSGTFRLRAVCVDDIIALYINGHYIDGDTDARLQQGAIGLTIGVPQAINTNNIALVDFDNLQVWQASLP